VAKGTSFGEFQKDIGYIIESKGWSGKAAFRVETIFRTNVLTAYSVGRYEQMQQRKDALPYWQYDAVGDSRTRPTHRALDGKVFRADDPIWDTWYPPNGFNCRCTVRALSAAEAQARGVAVENGRDVLDRPVEVEPGRLQHILPDPGWAYNPGRDWTQGIVTLATERSSRLRPVQGQPTAKDWGRPPLEDIPLESLPELRGGLPGRMQANEARRAFRQTFPEPVLMDGLGEPVIVGESLVEELLKHGANLEVVTLIPDVLKQPLEVYQTAMTRERGGIVLRRQYLKMWRIGDNRVVVVAQVDNSVLVGWTAQHGKVEKVEDLRVGYLLEPRKRTAGGQR
jgi:SPP1 gp7 family putative phage head morphogenesis protein